ncbi:hypothetical protein RHMOL_Rhmol08G0238900 [Rhododendron molle]|uniref:Uncharacterized protein n=1 Tax=Rhododendron molle TaxID=49168 RepID=A0ACC0MT32_RHOML|nr:hypothetical protein RHMOL_Rhmol08G0238900 [Rhododendron molle]
MEAGSVLHSYVLCSVLCGSRRRLAGIGPTIGDVHCVEIVELIFCTLVVLDELYAVDVSDRRADAGKAAPTAAQHAAQHVAVQHAPNFRGKPRLSVKRGDRRTRTPTSATPATMENEETNSKEKIIALTPLLSFVLPMANAIKSCAILPRELMTFSDPS